MNIRRWALLRTSMSRTGRKPGGDDDGARTPLQAVVLADSFTQVLNASVLASCRVLATHSSLALSPALRAALSPDQRGEAEGAHAAGERADVGLHAGVVVVCWCGGGASLLLRSFTRVLCL